MFRPGCIILRCQRSEANSVDPEVVAHYEPPYRDLGSLRNKLFSFLVLNPILHSEWSKLHRVLAILSAIGL